MYKRAGCSLLVAMTLSACDPPPAPTTPVTTATATPVPASPPAALNLVPRAELNRLAAELALPLFWVSDDGDGTVEPEEVAQLWGIQNLPDDHYVSGGAFTAAFGAAYDRIAERHAHGPSDPAEASPEEKARLAAVRKELAQGRPTLVHNDFAAASEQDRAIVSAIVAAGATIEKLHGMQIGSWHLRAEVPAADTASHMLMVRNQGPWCVAPQTEKDPACNALASKPAQISGLYPAWLQEQTDFCEGLKKEKDAETLRHQFHVVRGDQGSLKAVPYHQAYAAEMRVVSDKLKEAAAAIQSDDEAAFKAYLLAAAQAFLDDSWEQADEAWAKMNAENSRWYLRIGPDEVYFEPCSLKAGFHISFAKINQDSLVWQRKLDPVKGDMEKALAELAGLPYRARDVSFHLPDFIDIVLNAGDSRSPHGATIGQSLPNWGPVANEGRGRTVAMTNLYTDADSQRQLTEQASSLLCSDTMKSFNSDTAPQVMGSVLHEAAHNLGPAHEYKVKGKKATEIFGGPLASTLEELKAQTAALYFTDWLLERELLSEKQAHEAHVRDITWTFGHISRGLYTAEGRPRPYSQLSAIQVGYLLEHGALGWHADEKAANGEDVGCMRINLDKLPAATTGLMTIVAKIKGGGDKAGAEKLIADYVDVDGAKKALLDTITERWLRAPKATFVYSIDM